MLLLYILEASGKCKINFQAQEMICIESKEIEKFMIKLAKLQIDLFSKCKKLHKIQKESQSWSIMFRFENGRFLDNSGQKC